MHANTAVTRNSSAATITVLSVMSQSPDHLLGFLLSRCQESPSFTQNFLKKLFEFVPRQRISVATFHSYGQCPNWITAPKDVLCLIFQFFDFASRYSALQTFDRITLQTVCKAFRKCLQLPGSLYHVKLIGDKQLSPDMIQKDPAVASLVRRCQVRL